MLLQLGRTVRTWADRRGVHVAIAIVLFPLALMAPVDQTQFDTPGTLLTARSLLVDGTTALDRYPEFVRSAGYRVSEIDGHPRYVFPPGPAIAAVPLVALGVKLGIDPRDPQDDSLLQRLVAALVFSALWLVILAICRAFLPPATAILAALVLLLGTSFSSTVPTAYWNQGPTVFLVLSALALAVREEPTRIRGLVVGLLVGLAFWCRPTAAIAGVMLLLVVARGNRSTIVAYVLGGGLALMAFAFWSHSEYGQLLPPYYRPERVASWSAEATLGSLISPSRGLLVLSPFLVPLLLVAVWLRQGVLRRRLFWVGLLWILLQLFVLGRFQHWWGGHSFGSRLMLDALPGVVLVVVTVLAAAGSRSPRVVRTVWTAFLAFGLCAVWMNTAQGLYEPATLEWNAVPDVDRHPERLWSWSRPQWAATPESNFRAAIEWGEVSATTATDSLSAVASDSSFFGWRPVEYLGAEREPWRWTDGSWGGILWRTSSERGRYLELRLNASRDSRIRVRLDGITVGIVRHEGWDPKDYRLRVPDRVWAGRSGVDRTHRLVFESLAWSNLVEPVMVGFWNAHLVGPESAR